MIKVRVKAPWMDDKGLHKIGELTEIETAAFDPLRMVEIREKVSLVVSEPVTLEPEEVKPIKAKEDPEPPKKTTKKSTKKG